MKGVSYTYFTTDNAKSARELISILKEATAMVPPQLEEMAMYGGGGGGRSELCDVSITKYTDWYLQADMVAVAEDVAAAIMADTGAVLTTTVAEETVGDQDMIFSNFHP